MDVNGHSLAAETMDFVDASCNESTALAGLEKFNPRSLRYVDQEEPLDTPGIIPVHLKRAVTASYPLIEILQRIVYRLQPGTTMNSVLALIALYKAGQPVYDYVKNLLARLFTSQVTVSEYDPAAREILAYIAANVMPNSNWNTKAMLASGSGVQDAQDGFMRELMLQRYGRVLRESDEVQCMPPIGKKLFWVGYRPFVFSRAVNVNSLASSTRYSEGAPYPGYTITLTTLGWSLQPLRDFVKLCRKFKVKNAGENTTIYFSGGGGSGDYGGYGGGNWRSVTKAVRKLDTIDIDADVKTDLIEDAEDYYSAESKKFYTDCGIPYRRGYLFYGPPGTGKTSFSSALAGHLKCDMYMINLASGDISDGKLHSLFLQLPRKCVVVIEDIDSAGIGREREEELPPAPLLPPPGAPAANIPLPPKVPRNPARRNTVTLSGLLNAIDGNASQEGRLLIMTSNNPDALDEALTRPGRVDKKVQFGNLSKDSARGIFERLIGRAAIAANRQTPAQIKDMAVEFAGLLPADSFTPAQVQNFLQSCRGDADKAIAEVQIWAEKNVKSAATTTPEKPKPKQNGALKAPVAPFEPAAAVNGIDSMAMPNGLVAGSADSASNGSSPDGSQPDLSLDYDDGEMAAMEEAALMELLAEDQMLPT